MNERITSLYRHFDKHGRLLYVGVSMNVFSRFLQHAKRAEPVVRMEVQTYGTRKEALRAEKKAITEEKPIYNTQHLKAALRSETGTSMLAVRMPNQILNALDEITGTSFKDRTDAIVSLLSKGLKAQGLLNE